MVRLNTRPERCQPKKIFCCRVHPSATMYCVKTPHLQPARAIHICMCTLCRYFDLVPWQSLASMNQNFLLTERRRHYLRYAGGLCYFEVCFAMIDGQSSAESSHWNILQRRQHYCARQLIQLLLRSHP